MRNETRRHYTDYLNQIAQLNGIDPAVVAAGAKFSVEPSVQQTLETRIQESSDFLQKINMIVVPEQAGEKLGLGVSGPIARTTDTTSADRQTSDVHALDKDGYLCTQTNFDTHIRYGQLDAWAKFPDFQTRLRNQILIRSALDRIMIGFNGTSRAATSNPATNPMRQDVNIGWLQKYRANAAARVLSEVVAASGEITIGDTGDYKNLDALVFDLVNAMIEPWYQEDPELVVICGRQLLADKYFPIINATQAPTEQLATHLIVSQKRIGNLPAVRVPFFPANALMVTRMDNLSIYMQEGSRRRSVIDNPKRDRIEDYESSNDAYVVEDYGCGAVAENIVIA